MTSRIDNQRAKIAVIGAGVVGLSIAVRLIREHRNVVLVERGDPGGEASSGNAGHIATEQIFPLASPATLLKTPAFLIGGRGPLFIRRKYATRILPWLIKFAWAARPDSFRRGTAALASLQSGAMESLQTLCADAGISDLLHRRGHLIVVENERNKSAMQARPAALSEQGIAAEWLSPEAVAERAPELKKGIAGALHFRDTGHVSDPYLVCKGLQHAFLAAGGRLIGGDVQNVLTGFDGSFELQMNSGSLLSDKVIIAAGAWSKTIAAQLGCDVPLDTERGYNITAEGWQGRIDLSIASHERMTIMTPLNRGLRITGFVEFGGLQLPPARRRLEALKTHLRELVPDAGFSELTEWMGFRPSLPDHLPVIGPGPSNENAIFAFGHQHLGLTLAGITADIVAALAAGRAAPVDLRPFRPDRF